MSAEVATLPSRTSGAAPHAGQRLATAGAPLSRARLAVVMLHGRGGSPEDMLGLHAHLALPDIMVIAPAAAGRSWWPDSFLAPLAVNEPGLSSGLSIVAAMLDDLERAGFGPERVVLAGFSQGACLALEAAARLARPFHAVAALSGGLVGTGEGDGPPRDDLYGRRPKTFDYDGSLADVPVLIGCHERDPHIPLARVNESGDVLSHMGADVETLVIPGAGHGIVAEEAAWLRGQLNAAPTRAGRMEGEA
ncbi:alpha/beta hydrolase [Qingshengfaniella alkalisoli]|uniref:Phospholipase n=1 Tax=Qingshengfaniella alkalisoli TaxID=2599296 RepID=A0A5B8IW45_9RHOB|nr:dienelactone hydrolase family protein [Qingshengfaniella alkalisoli]QDY70372.1 phospholipase [Qingshengfaniella alkalisoli]